MKGVDSDRLGTEENPFGPFLGVYALEAAAEGTRRIAPHRGESAMIGEYFGLLGLAALFALAGAGIVVSLTPLEKGKSFWRRLLEGSKTLGNILRRKGVS